MTSIELAPEIADDFERILDHLERHEVNEAPRRILDLIAAIDVLASNPLIGRPAGGSDFRELVIGRDARGYVALYRYLPSLDRVFVLAIRSQREAGYRHL